MARTIPTTWDVFTYDVWGNARDGYEVNNTFRAGTVTIRCPIVTYNVGQPGQFDSAAPTDAQIRKALGLRRIQLAIDGDDLNIEVEHAKDGYPLARLECTSHACLSPIRKKGD